MYLKSLFVGLVFLPAAIFGQTHWESLVVADNTWKYQQAVSEPDGNWNSQLFDDNSWPAGTGGFGYGDEDDNTVIAASNSVYLRINFTISDISQIERLLLDVDFDDAYVAYLNGQEIARSFNIADAIPVFNSALSTDREAQLYQGGQPERTEIGVENLLSGENLLAVQVLNSTISSSDLSSLVFLHALVNSPNQLYQAVPAWFREPVSFNESNLPIIIITTNGQPIPDEPRITAHMGIIDNQVEINRIGDPYNGYDGNISIEIRGSSSQMFEKKNFGFETQTDTGTNQNVSLLGMPEENDWVLHGPYSDKSLMRNALTYQLGNLTGSWAPRCRFCELYINNSYNGVYVLMEKIKIDKNRLAIANLKPEDISGDELTGGYLLKIDRPEEGYWVSPYLSDNGWSTIQISYADPEYSEMVPLQRNYIKNYVTSFENALHGSSFKDPNTGYRAYIDVQSFVDFYLINELSKNVDAYRLSTFFYKDKDSKGGKLKMGPLWDFNLSFGNADYYNCQYTDGWFADGMSSGDSWQPPFWWQRLREDPYFNAQLAIRWFSLRKTVFSDLSIENYIDSIASLLDAAQQRNFQQFPVLNQYVWPNSYIGGSYSNEINFLKDWTFDRLSWMDSQLGLINAVEEPEESLADASSIYPYPNPFAESLVFRVSLRQKARVSIRIADLKGTSLVFKTYEAEQGLNELPVETHIFGNEIGIYIYELSINGNPIQSGKLVRRAVE